MALESVAATRSSDRIPPHNLEAEESVLGSMILSHQATAEVQDIVSCDDFYKESHRIIYRALTELYALGATTDHVILAEELKKRGQLEASGDRAYLLTLTDTTPNPHNAKHYASIVRDMALRRNLIDIGYDITGMGFQVGDEFDNLYDGAEQSLYNLGKRMRREGLTHIKNPLLNSFNRMSEAKDKGSPITGVPTGFYDLDRITSGLQPSNLVIVGGRTSMGKTSLALNIAHHAAVREGIGVLIFSLEMNKTDIAERLLLSEARVDSSKYRTGNVDDKEMDRIVNAAGILNQAPIFIDDMGDVKLLEMRSIARKLMSTEKNVGLIIVDYIQLLYSDKRSESRAQEVSRIARDLKVMAMDLEVPVIAASQLRRPPPTTTRKDPSLEDLKESGGIEQNADVVILIYRPEMDDPKNMDVKGIAEINLAKHRNGRTARFKLYWMGSYSKFENPAEEDLLQD
ncbi:MAG: replicative DNA helicase [Candidatus Anoxymicrobium japonicum]|uniref:Replicative DNA helicase n=1 Tax=Candidatus Anoxymicrobium japonicum TaxID=2013648 RepID=A0A2N3G5K8_9ACTN|nr:MAG: replicative DNA helicase [Candidatus Anoxymicrobium japonicum]